jgi:transcriptional regulator of aromatic amino acid metabolism
LLFLFFLQDVTHIDGGYRPLVRVNVLDLGLSLVGFQVIMSGRFWVITEEKKFQRDLYYRLNVFPIDVPPLRDRRDDIPLLVHYFANKYARRMGKQIESIPNETMDALSRYSWPGNIRELQNLMERAALLSTGPSLRVPLAEILNDPGFSGGNALEQAEREQILRALRESNWVVGGARGAAARLGLKRTSLAYKMDKLGISRPPSETVPNLCLVVGGVVLAKRQPTLLIRVCRVNTLAPALV